MQKNKSTGVYLVAVRFRRGAPCGLGILVLLSLGGCVEKEPDRNPMSSIRAKDIGETVQILGTCNQPLGELVTVCGVWRNNDPGKGGPDWIFIVTNLNGKPLEKPIELDDPRPYGFPNFKGAKGIAGDPFIWRFVPFGEDEAPTPENGDRWELDGVETGNLAWHSEEVEGRTFRGTMQRSPRTVFEKCFLQFHYFEIRTCR